MEPMNRITELVWAWGMFVPNSSLHTPNRHPGSCKVSTGSRWHTRGVDEQASRRGASFASMKGKFSQPSDAAVDHGHGFPGTMSEQRPAHAELQLIIH